MHGWPADADNPQRRPLLRTRREMEESVPKIDGTMTSTVLFLPWVQIENPIAVGGGDRCARSKTPTKGAPGTER